LVMLMGWWWWCCCLVRMAGRRVNRERGRRTVEKLEIETEMVRSSLSAQRNLIADSSNSYHVLLLSQSNVGDKRCPRSISSARSSCAPFRLIVLSRDAQLIPARCPVPLSPSVDRVPVFGPSVVFGPSPKLLPTTHNFNPISSSF
jgi:hypothetical protein